MKEYFLGADDMVVKVQGFIDSLQVRTLLKELNSTFLDSKFRIYVLLLFIICFIISKTSE